ncbi:MAG: HEPN domain-containing protein [Cardiobacteriaceae bacterium]|nr:HEPN domain-containing protein [Cardiobacteriaceae bacterium]
MTMTSDALLALFKAGKSHFTPAFDLRLYRAISWLKKAESTEDLDIRFISLWIAFNAAYAKELEAGSLSDRSAFRQFLHTLCHLDKSQQIYQLVWETFPGSIRMLLDNRFVFQAFWDFQNGKISQNAWVEDFERGKNKARKALANRDTDNVLLIVFDRLYTLRNQLVHGGATHGSGVNRRQLADACAILGRFLPLMLQIMLENHARPDWGKPFYPVIKEE